jgi:hypothetical protein
MDDIFTPLVEAAEFQDLFEPAFTPLELDDSQYRTLIRAKVALNNVSAVMTSDERISIQEVVQSIFGGTAYVLDNLNMTLTLFVGGAIDEQLLRIVNRLNLLPKPQGVRYSIFIEGGLNSFAFDDDPTGLGFGDAFDPSIGGQFAEILFI